MEDGKIKQLFEATLEKVKQNKDPIPMLDQYIIEPEPKITHQLELYDSICMVPFLSDITQALRKYEDFFERTIEKDDLYEFALHHYRHLMMSALITTAKRESHKTTN